MCILHLHVLDAKDVGYSNLVQHLLQKEKVLLSMGDLKYTFNTFVKDNRKPYIKKDDKLVHMDDRPKSPIKPQ